jgi:hypothetical protein
MSGAYSLFHVFNELLDEKANKNSTARGKTMGAKSEIYQGAWSALNAWIETKLAKQKVRCFEPGYVLCFVTALCVLRELEFLGSGASAGNSNRRATLLSAGRYL